MTLSRAGKNHLTTGTVAGGICVGLFYLCWHAQFLPLSMLVLLAVGLGASSLSILWGGAVAPRLANRRLRREIGHGRARRRAELPAPERAP